MKLEIFKSMLVVALSMTIGFLLEIIAPEAGCRNLISLGVGFVSMLAMLLPAIGIIYNDTKRGISVKIFAWIMAVVLLFVNLIFACYEYKIDV